MFDYFDSNWPKEHSLQVWQETLAHSIQWPYVDFIVKRLQVYSSKVVINTCKFVHRKKQTRNYSYLSLHSSSKDEMMWHHTSFISYLLFLALSPHRGEFCKYQITIHCFIHHTVSACYNLHGLLTTSRQTRRKETGERSRSEPMYLVFKYWFPVPSFYKGLRWFILNLCCCKSLPFEAEARLNNI
jgi:hypothetical protein